MVPRLAALHTAHPGIDLRLQTFKREPDIGAEGVSLATVANLLDQALIHLKEPFRDRPSWADFFDHWQVPYTEPRTGLRLNDYALILQAAIAGEGFAFGWQHVTKGLISQGLLAARPECSWKTGAGFYLVWSATTHLSPQAEKLRDWLTHLS